MRPIAGDRLTIPRGELFRTAETSHHFIVTRASRRRENHDHRAPRG
jgi:hypothetical protein